MSAWDLQFPALNPEWDYGDGRLDWDGQGDGSGVGSNVLSGEASNNGWGTGPHLGNGPSLWALSTTGDGSVPDHLGAHNVVPRLGKP